MITKDVEEGGKDARFEKQETVVLYVGLKETH